MGGRCLRPRLGNERKGFGTEWDGMSCFTLLLAPARIVLSDPLPYARVRCEGGIVDL